MDSLVLSRQHFQQLIQHLEEVYPEEGCGLIAGDNGVVQNIYPIRNRLASNTEYEMDPGEQLAAMLEIDRSEMNLLAIYHSHPFGPSEPSVSDISKAYYPEAAHLIISWDVNHNPTMRVFSILAGSIIEQQLDVGS
jgi:proteasome lid subunit RPN8/RPN11